VGRSRRALVAAAGGGLLVLLLVFGGGVVLYLRASLPDDPPRLVLEGLGDSVRVRYDARRRPYVQARTYADALVALGWLHARERLWQMELLRRAGRARLAEALGASALETDVELVRIGVPEVAEALERNARPSTRAAVAHYIAGVNAALARRDVRPPELALLGVDAAPWRPRDVYAVGAIMAFDSANNYRQELLRLAIRDAVDPARFRLFLPEESAFPEFPYVVPGRKALALLARSDAAHAPTRAAVPSTALGSSSWAVAPARSASGKALFAFDSHDAWSMPPLLYEAHLFYGEGESPRALRGWTAPGLPGVINGFTRDRAWGLTNIGDTQDLFVETRDPDDPLRFRGRAGWYRAEAWEVGIPVAGREAPHRVRLVETRNGRLLSEDPPISIRWTAHHLGGHGLGALLAMNRAQSREAFERALDDFAAPSSNVTYADEAGHLATRVVGRLPVRGRGVGLVPQPGDAVGSGWKGFVPPAALPRLRDPERGWVAAANARTQPPGTEPLVSADNAPGYRMRRLREVLGDGDALDADAMQRLQVDWRNTQAALLLPALLPDVRAGSLGSRARAALGELREFAAAPVNEPGSAGALLFAQWYIALADAVFEEALGPELHARLLHQRYVLNHALDRLILAEPESSWWRGERAGLVTASLVEAVRRLHARLGGAPADWRWDVVHGVRFEHTLAGAVPGLGALLSRGPYPWGGGNPTLGRARYPYDEPFQATGGASMRLVVEMGVPLRARAVSAGGQSGHFASPHYDDQLEAWLAGELDPLATRPEAVGAVTTTLVPAETSAGPGSESSRGAGGGGPEARGEPPSRTGAPKDQAEASSRR